MCRKTEDEVSRKGIHRRLVATLVIVSGSLGLAPSANAEARVTVCASGCSFTSIQSAINMASAGGVITVGPGRYVENLVVNKALTINGSGNSTVLYPATVGPVCSSGSGSLCPGSSNMILIQASNVTIENIRLEGDNPNLISGVVVGGADIEARNGIIEDFNAGALNNTTVTHVSVSDIYLRAIYMSSGGSGFNVSDNRIDNVQGSPSSIAIFSFGGSGVFSQNEVSHANDAISANWSTGTSFLNNEISKSGSGIHTDNSGSNGSSTDVIRGNEVTDCMTDGYGIFVFAQYRAVTVDQNSVKGCYVGIGVFGSQLSGGITTMTNNQVSGDHAVTTDSSGTYGAFVVTDLLGFGVANVSAVLTGNHITRFTTGLFVSQATGVQATVIAHQNSFVRNATGVNGKAGTTVTADANWWGCPQGPSSSKQCDSAVGTATYTPWLTQAIGKDD